VSDTDNAYIGFETCGCPTFAMVAGYESPGQEQREIAKVIEEGRRVEVMTVGEARALLNFLNCPHSGPRISDPWAHARSLVERARARPADQLSLAGAGGQLEREG
jgi:hypothetical protein